MHNFFSDGSLRNKNDLNEKISRRQLGIELVIGALGTEVLFCYILDYKLLFAITGQQNSRVSFQID